MKIYTSKVLLGLMLMVLFFTQPGLAQTSEELRSLKKELEDLKESQKAVQKDLQEIKNLLRAKGFLPEEPKNLFFNIVDKPFRGDKNAKLTLIEFSEYQWPYCARYVRETWPQIQRDFVDTGKIKYVFLDFPLESIHKNALKAAEASRCAVEQGTYWEMHDQLFTNPNALEIGDLFRHSQILGLNSQKLQECLESGKYVNEIRKDISEGQKAGVRGTPTFFIGVSEGEDTKIKALKVIRGAKPYIEFKQAFDSLLDPQK